MSSFLMYMIKVCLITGILFSFYRVFLSKTSFHSLNRVFLLLIIPCSLICPALEFESSIVNQLTNYRLWLDESGEFSQTEIQKVLEAGTSSPFPINIIIVCVYLAGVFIFLIPFVRQLFSLVKLKGLSTSFQMENFMLIYTDNMNAPFSFFRWIFLPEIYSDFAYKSAIIEHEMVHSKQLHSVDLLIAECFCIAFWFNPFVFLLKQSLKTVHEFIADGEVINKSVSAEKYLKLLVSAAEMSCLSGIANHFKCLTIKKRVEMITKNKTSKIFKLSYLLIIPVLVLSVMAFGSINLTESDIGLKDGNVPCIKPVKENNIERISAGWGIRKHPITKEMKMHEGIDIVAKTGTPVLATADGKVIKVEFIEEGKGYGRLVVVQHNETYTTLYSQLSGFKVQAGDQVKQGDIVGFVGQSGISTGPHLHYEVWKNGKRVNPEEYFE